YALPLYLIASLAGTSRSAILSQLPLAFVIFLSMILSYAATFAIAFLVFKRRREIASLQALAIAGPAVPLVGTPLLGHLFGVKSVVPISVSALVFSVILLPLTLVVLSSGSTAPLSSVRKAFRQPLVWGALLGLAIVLAGMRIPVVLQDSLMLLGSATGGVALFASGVVVYSQRAAFTWPVAVSVLGRNVLVPSLAWAGAWAFLPHTELQELVLTMAIPVPVFAVILAEQYQLAQREMASTLFFSTILSMITMGVFIWLLGA
ncbi:MAG TPA: AEC family transporter, partial [Candidatus Baltobacteraceae bacterium]|nr:AEC family transporter [Candidatus Baltobacteraceae bacterium]